MRKTLAVYHYPVDKKTIEVSIDTFGKLKMYDEKGRVPYCKAINGRTMMRDYTTADNTDVPSYEEVGLFYGYSMPEMGWGDA